MLFAGPKLVFQSFHAKQRLIASPAMAAAGDTDIESGLLSGAAESADVAEAQAQVVEAGAATRSTRVRVAPVFHWAGAMCLFSSLLCLMTIFSFVLVVYLLYEFFNHWRDTCDVPLQLWVVVVLVTAIFNLSCNQQDRNGSLGARIFCRWSFDPENPQRMPARVHAYNMMVPIFTALWNIVGLFWVSKAHDPKDGLHDLHGNSTVHLEEEVISRCTEVAPGLLSAVRVYAGFNLFYTFFILIGVAGLSQVLLCLTRYFARYFTKRGRFPAPPGSLERNTEEVGIDDPATADHPQCPICLEDWAEGDTLVKAHACGHIFHKEHLQNWLMVDRTCPLCRVDLGRTNTTELAEVPE